VPRTWQFDSNLTRRYTQVREAFAGEFLAEVRKQEVLDSAADVGCGVGYFSKFLSELGLRVVAVDARQDNVDEGKRRYPEITFLVQNVEGETLPQIGTFDFVLCVGLLYHLENPFRAIRNLHAITAKVLLVEAMCVPGTESNLELLDEHRAEDQGLNYVAFYPTESCIVKMLYRAGFPFVYRFKKLPADGQFKSTLWRKRSRTILAASKIELTARNLVLVQEAIRLAPGRLDPWVTTLSRVEGLLDWGLWSAKLFHVRVLAAGWAKQWRKEVNSSSSGGNFRPR
jgi:SAM-dependent methyltransferase